MRPDTLGAAAPGQQREAYALPYRGGDLRPHNAPPPMAAQDFGLSNRLDGQATHVSNFGAGTPFYVAPEVVNAKRTSPASDIFSFGVVAWQVRLLVFAAACPSVGRSKPVAQPIGAPPAVSK